MSRARILSLVSMAMVVSACVGQASSRVTKSEADAATDGLWPDGDGRDAQSDTAGDADGSDAGDDESLADGGDAKPADPSGDAGDGDGGGETGDGDPPAGDPLAAPNPPLVDGVSPTNNPKPSWTWVSGGGTGNGTFRYKLDNSNLSTGATTTNETSFTPDAPLVNGAHKLYVQEQNSDEIWSTSGNYTIVVDTMAPVVTRFRILESGQPCSCTSDNSFDLDIAVADGLGSGLSDMRFRNSGGTWTDWQAYATTVSGFAGEPGYGLKTVEAEFRDRATNVASATPASITYDDLYEGCYGNNELDAGYDLGLFWEQGGDSTATFSGGLLADEDWFLATVAAGVSVSVTASLTLGSGSIGLAVYDSGGDLLQSGSLVLDNCLSSSELYVYLQVTKPDAAWGAQYELTFTSQNDSCL